MKRSLSCVLGRHQRCSGSFYLIKKPEVCWCECHARHIAPTLDELRSGK